MNGIPRLSYNSQFAIYVAVSTGAAVLAVYPIIQSSPNYYSAGIRLTEGFSTVICANWLLSISLSIGKILQMIMFGELRLIEVEHIMDNSRFAVFNSLIALSMFSNDFILIPAILTLFSLFMKVFHWILNDRFDFIFQHANRPIEALFTKNTVVLFVLFYVDYHLAYTCLEYSFGNNPDVYFSFGFEFALLFLDLTLLAFKIGLNSWELKYLHENPDEDTMEEKSWYMKIVEIAHTFLTLTIQLFLLYTFFRPYRFPIHLFKDIFSNTYTLIKKLGELQRYIKATRELETKLQDATSQDLNDDNNLCIVCRDDMTLEGVRKGQRLFPKKLHCGHIIHLGCLKGWFERSQVCPMCRAPVFASTSSRARTSGNFNNANNININNININNNINIIINNNTNNNALDNDNVANTNLNNNLNINSNPGINVNNISTSNNLEQFTDNNSSHPNQEQMINSINLPNEPNFSPIIRERAQFLRDDRDDNSPSSSVSSNSVSMGRSITAQHMNNIGEPKIPNAECSSSTRVTENQNSSAISNTLRLKKSEFLPKDWKLFKLQKKQTSKNKNTETTETRSLSEHSLVLNNKGEMADVFITKQE